MDIKMLAVTGGVGLAVGFVAGFLAGRGASGSGSGKKQVSSVAGSEPTGEGIELYVGNLSYDMTDPDLEKAFTPFGKVLSARIIKNKFNERSKGYGFVEMEGQSGADKAVKAMNGKDVLGRKLVVNEARSKSRE
jgi:cold-inducible RNA-binding protein